LETYEIKNEVPKEDKQLFETIKKQIRSLNIDEKSLVQDLINCLSNSRGKFIRYEEIKKEFEITGNSTMNVQT